MAARTETHRMAPYVPIAAGGSESGPARGVRFRFECSGTGSARDSAPRWLRAGAHPEGMRGY